MFNSWDLVRPRFWYPMSSLEQSLMDFEKMSDARMRRSTCTTPHWRRPSVRKEEITLMTNDFFVDLPVTARKYMPRAALDDKGEVTSKAKADTNPSVDMEVDEDGDQENETANTTQAKKDGNKNKEYRKHHYKIAPKSDRTYSSYLFSNSSVVDKGRRVTMTRRRYEDSSGRLKAVHEREIDGKKLRTTWSRQNKEVEGQHQSLCTSGSPDEFEALWQQTPFGEAQKKTVKVQLQSESDVENEAAKLDTAD